MWELDHKEGWASKNGCFWTVVLEKTLENRLDVKEIKPINPKGNQPWISTGKTDTEAETLILWPPDAKNWVIGRAPSAGKIESRWRNKRQRMRWLYGISTQWTCVWASFRRQWRTEDICVLQSMGLQRVRHDWATEQQQQECWGTRWPPCYSWHFSPQRILPSMLFPALYGFSCKDILWIISDPLLSTIFDWVLTTVTLVCQLNLWAQVLLL